MRLRMLRKPNLWAWCAHSSLRMRRIHPGIRRRRATLCENNGCCRSFVVRSRGRFILAATELHLTVNGPLTRRSTTPILLLASSESAKQIKPYSRAPAVMISTSAPTKSSTKRRSLNVQVAGMAALPHHHIILSAVRVRGRDVLGARSLCEVNVPI